MRTKKEKKRKGFVQYQDLDSLIVHFDILQQDIANLKESSERERKLIKLDKAAQFTSRINYLNLDNAWFVQTFKLRQELDDKMEEIIRELTPYLVEHALKAEELRLYSISIQGLKEHYRKIITLLEKMLSYYKQAGYKERIEDYQALTEVYKMKMTVVTEPPSSAHKILKELDSKKSVQQFASKKLFAAKLEKNPVVPLKPTEIELLVIKVSENKHKEKVSPGIEVSSLASEEVELQTLNPKRNLSKGSSSES